MTSLLVILVLSIHLLAMNLASAGPLIGIWLRRPAATDDSFRDDVGLKMAWLSVYALLLGVLTGGGQLYFAPTTGLLAALDRLPSRALWFAAVELVFSLVCLLLYAGCWRLLHRRRWAHGTLALLSSTNLLYHFPPLMSILGRLANDPTWAKAPVLDRSALLPLMVRGEVLALTAHFILASLAVAAITVFWLASRANEQQWQQSARLLSGRGAWVALTATALQLPVGVWLLVSLPRTTRTAMLGENTIASLTFVGALLLTVLLLQRLLAIAVGAVERRDLQHTCWLLAALVLMMTTTLYTSRSGRNQLNESNTESKTAVEQIAPQLLGQMTLLSNRLL